jgi:hypothetical protein
VQRLTARPGADRSRMRRRARAARRARARQRVRTCVRHTLLLPSDLGRSLFGTSAFAPLVKDAGPVSGGPVSTRATGCFDVRCNGSSEVRVQRERSSCRQLDRAQRARRAQDASLLRIVLRCGNHST